MAPTTIEELDDFAGPGGAGTRDGISQAVGAEAAGQIEALFGAADGWGLRRMARHYAALAAETTAIAAEEQALNEKLYVLYGLSGAERLPVENEATRKTRR